MLEVKGLRENPEGVREALARRQMEVSFETWVALDRQQRALKGRIESLQHEKNRASEQIARQKREGGDMADILTRMKAVAGEIGALSTEISAVERQTDAFLLGLPNLPHASVPWGKDERDNQEIRQWGEKPRFSFTPKPHFEIGERLGILDFDRGAKLTGARFTLYRGWGARLERALTNFMLDLHTRDRHYEEVLPPFMVNEESMTGTGQLPKFAEDLFRLQDPPYFLIPTAEVPLINIHRGEILDADDLPRSYVAATPCFRREAGSYGRDTRGLIRQHQFNKVELVKLATPEDSYALLEQLLADAEAVLQKLGLHYRVVALCTGDLGFSAAKTYDIEVWLPAQGVYREISSCSNCEGFQSRRAQIRYRTREGKVRDLHTLNGSGLAVGRTVVALLENYQCDDGSVQLPDALRPYMGGMDRISPT
jgi:seryl-tRNA synthetase